MYMLCFYKYIKYKNNKYVFGYDIYDITLVVNEVFVKKSSSCHFKINFFKAV